MLQDSVDDPRVCNEGDNPHGDLSQVIAEARASLDSQSGFDNSGGYRSCRHSAVRLLVMDNTTYPVSYSYTEAGCGCSKRDLQSITYPGGIQVNYAHDSIGRLSSITETYNGAHDATYVGGLAYASQSGLLSQIAYGTGTDTFTFEDSGRLQSIAINLCFVKR
jgi:hypothetical protein